MLRVIFVHSLLFFLPFVAYGFWLLVTRRQATQDDWRKAPMLWLSIAGGVLVIFSLMFLATFDDTPPDASYTPPRLEDGQLVPGRLE